VTGSVDRDSLSPLTELVYAVGGALLVLGPGFAMDYLESTRSAHRVLDTSLGVVAVITVIIELVTVRGIGGALTLDD